PKIEEREIGDAARVRLVKKEMAKLEKQIEKLSTELSDLKEQEAEAAFDHKKLLDIGNQIKDVGSRKDSLEMKWLELSEQVK
ncbi:MAG: ABC transporter ATP-binding protein, partial [Actinobacteria bacterium]|nr:ABC transporter ATP-binding protein [Actinomycetota bacterium]